MYLTRLELTDFRNLSRLSVDVPKQTIAILGQNAQGKTSVLEAIYMLATLTSFHADNDRQVINFIAAEERLAVARVVANFCRGSREHRIELRIIQERSGLKGTPRTRKETLVDGIKKKGSEVIGLFNAVLFLPQMLQIVEGSPSHRRRYLDLALAQVIVDYTARLSAYNKTLTQRNALLKQLGEYGGDQSQMGYWDEQLTSLGAQLIYDRIHAIQEIGIQAGLIHGDLTRQKEVMRLDYRPSQDPQARPANQMALALDDPKDRSMHSVDEIQHGFLAALEANRPEEIARGVTTLGPHRDELRFLSNGVDLGTYGSRGQIRTTLLTLKLAEAAWMQQKSGHWPVFLLDEVMAELDVIRRADLIGHIAGSEQTLLTTTDRNLFSEKFLEKAEVWEIDDGVLNFSA
jgi:DNA replication and repair protein RecF